MLVHAAFQRAKTDAHKTFTFTLAVKGWKEIGRTQGWIVRSGDKITITSDGYTDLQSQVP